MADAVSALFVCLFVSSLTYLSVNLFIDPSSSLVSLLRLLGGTRSTRSSSTLASCWWPWTPGLQRTGSRWATTLCSHCATLWSTARKASGSAVTPSTSSRRRSPFSSSSSNSPSYSSPAFYSRHCLLYHFPPIYALYALLACITYCFSITFILHLLLFYFFLQFYIPFSQCVSSATALSVYSNINSFINP